MVLNFNVGLLGHVDSGKTSLAKVLSEVASTACFDKSPQSQIRGITLDLGFSSLCVPMPEHLTKSTEEETLRFTLVDCPGHAKLIRTIIGGAQIIDMMLLVIDATKGIQTQTAECIVIGEVTCKKMIIVLNKIDLLLEENRAKLIEKLVKRIKAALESTPFKDVAFVSVAAHPTDNQPSGVADLIKVMSENAFIPYRDCKAPFVMAVDHCFTVSGQGTIMTGTILQGMVKLGDSIHIPSLNMTKKVKSLEVFHQSFAQARQGDRVGMCVTQVESHVFERGLICQSDLIKYTYCAIISVNRIKHFKPPIKSKAKFHISVGHDTIMAQVTFFSLPKADVILEKFNYDLEYRYCEELEEHSNEISEICFALLEFQKVIYTVPNCLVIGSKFDMDSHTSSCRLAFSGNILETMTDVNYKKNIMPKLKIYKIKTRTGVIDRVVNEQEIIVKNMFGKETNVQPFFGLVVSLSTGETGKINSSFGLSGKVKVVIENNLKKETIEYVAKKKNKILMENQILEAVKVSLVFKRYVFDLESNMYQ